jgi:hypothetical protein
MGYPLSNSKTTPAEAGRTKRLEIREVAMGAILAEQLSYLLDHVGSCLDDCPDCTRLRSVEQILLQPFTVGSLGEGMARPSVNGQREFAATHSRTDLPG